MALEDTIMQLDYSKNNLKSQIFLGLENSSTLNSQTVGILQSSTKPLRADQEGRSGGFGGGTPFCVASRRLL